MLRFTILQTTTYIHVPSFLLSFFLSLLPSSLLSFLPSFLHFFLPSSLLSFIPSILHFYSFLPILSSLSFSLPFFVPSLLSSNPSFHSFLLSSSIPSFLPSFLPFLIKELKSPKFKNNVQVCTHLQTDRPTEKGIESTINNNFPFP